MRPWLALALAAALAGCLQVQVGQAPPAAETAKPGASIAVSPSAPVAGQAVTFQGTVRSPTEDDSLKSVTWSFGDGTTGKGLTVKHSYAKAGPYLVRLVAETALSGKLTASRELTVSAPPAGAPKPTSSPGTGGSAQQPLGLEPAITVTVERNVASFSYTLEQPADRVAWDFGDGATSNETAPTHAYLSKGNFTVGLRVIVGSFLGSNSTSVAIAEVPFQPHVIVGVADSGFNVYHQVYRRPGLTAHPCTYIRGYPCDIPALNLTFDAPTWDAAFAADRAKWEAIKPGDRFWIPGTNIVTAICDMPYSYNAVTEEEDPAVGTDLCILDDTEMHGTGTTSSVLSENPDALLVVAEGKTTARKHFATGELPVDIISHSWGPPAPTPLPCSGTYSCTPQLFEVTASGNEGAFPVVLDGAKSHPSYLLIGAADAGSRSEPGYSGFKTMDFVSEYCRPTAQTRSFTATREQYCGTSFSAPTFAGALSRVVLELRRASGYDGTIRDRIVDPVLGVSMDDVRDALNHTATYDPEDKWGDGGDTVPLVAPWYQWGWGYYDSTQVDETLACLLQAACPERPLETVTYMEALWAYRQAYHTV